MKSRLDPLEALARIRGYQKKYRAKDPERWKEYNRIHYQTKTKPKRQAEKKNKCNES